MEIRYDDESTEATKLIYSRLREMGLDEFVEGAEEQLKVANQSLSNVLDRAKAALAADDLDLAIQLLPDDEFPVYFATGTITLSRSELLQYTNSTRPGLRENIAKAVALLFELLTPNNIYEPKLPINVLVALDSMFQAVVVPLRCFDDATFECQRTCGSALTFEDETGQIFYSAEQRLKDTANEQAFWELVDLILDQWNLRPRLSEAVIEMKPVVYGADVYANAIASVSNLYLERLAA